MNGLMISSSNLHNNYVYLFYNLNEHKFQTSKRNNSINLANVVPNLLTSWMYLEFYVASQHL